MSPKPTLGAALALMILTGNLACGQSEGGPMVARVQMRLMLNEKILDTIEVGDLLTVVAQREDSVVIRTFSGQKGAVGKNNVVSLAEATPIYDALIEKAPDDGRLHTLRAGTHWAKGETEAALKDFDKAIELGYREAHAYSSRGLFHAAYGNYDQAIADFTEAQKLDSSDDVPILNRASVYVSRGDYAEAIGDYTRALEMNPQNHVVYSQRAVARKASGDLSGAIKDYTETLELSQEDVSAWMGRGFLYFQLGEHRKAIADFSRAIELEPKTAVAFNNRGYNHQQLGDHKAALKDYVKAVELAPRYRLALQNLAWLLSTGVDEALRDPDTAIKAGKTICELSSYKSYSDLTLLAAAYASAKDFETAIGWQEKAAEFAEDAAQKKLCETIIERYAHEQPFDPSLLTGEDDGEAETTPKPAPALPGDSESSDQ